MPGLTSVMAVAQRGLG